MRISLYILLPSFAFHVSESEQAGAVSSTTLSELSQGLIPELIPGTGARAGTQLLTVRETFLSHVK